MLPIGFLAQGRDVVFHMTGMLQKLFELAIVIKKIDSFEIRI